MKNRTIIGAISIFLALVLVFGGTFVITKSADKSIYTISATQNIAKGTHIEAGAVQIKKVSQSTVADMGRAGSDVVAAKDEKEARAALSYFVGKFSRTDIYRGDVLTSQKVGENPNEGVNALIESDHKNKIAVAIPLPSSSTQQVANSLKVGDIVSIIATKKNSAKNGYETLIPLKYTNLELKALTTSTGIDIDDAPLNDDGSKPQPSNAIFLMSPELATLVRSEIVSGVSFYFSIVYRGTDAAYREELLKVHEDYETALVKATELEMQKRYAALKSGKVPSYNAYYAEHSQEITALADEIFDYVFGQHVNTDADAILSQYEESGADSQSGTQDAKTPEQEESTNG